MPLVKAVIFDFIGTLTKSIDYSPDRSKTKLYEALVKAGFRVNKHDFFDAYGRSHEKCRVTRYKELIEITDAVWVSDALSCLGFKTDQRDPRVTGAVSAFFENFLDSLELNACAVQLLEWVSSRFKVGLISNFTYAPVIYAALRKLKINRFFNAVLVSEDVGWRKPHPRLFAEALRRLGVKADETVYVGDSPLEDIAGSARAGMKTVFLPSQFYSFENLHESSANPDLIVGDVCQLCKALPEFVKSLEKTA